MNGNLKNYAIDVLKNKFLTHKYNLNDLNNLDFLYFNLK